MNTHKNARMTPLGRALLVHRVREKGWRVTAAAQAAGVSDRTAYKWLARFIQTSLREWIYGEAYASSAERTAAMKPWLTHYNTQRPHSALKHSPPWQRLNNLLGNNS
jgi:transposase InsO family protein